MKKHLAAVVFAAFTVALAVGCQPSAPTTVIHEREKETNIHIRTPGANVDIQGKGKKDTNVDVDVHRKDKNP
jgi:hypothetical protein